MCAPMPNANGGRLPFDEIVVVEINGHAAEHADDDQGDPQHAIDLAPARHQVGDLQHGRDDADDGGQHDRRLGHEHGAARHEAAHVLAHDGMRGVLVAIAPFEDGEEQDDGE